MRFLFLSLLMLSIFSFSKLKADDSSNTKDLSNASNLPNTANKNIDLNNNNNNSAAPKKDTTNKKIKEKNDSNQVNLSDLNKIIDQQYSYLDDLNLDIDDIIPISGDPGNYVIIYLEKKPIVIRLFPEYAPKTVSFFKKLIREKFYDDTDFFRLIPNYIIQGGDPTSSGYGGTGKLRNAEISKNIKFQRGTVAIANNGDLKSDDSQFFISFDSFPWLDGKYTIFGTVISGMKFLENLAGTYSNDGFLAEPVIIERVVVAKDLPKDKILNSTPNSSLAPVRLLKGTNDKSNPEKNTEDKSSNQSNKDIASTQVKTAPVNNINAKVADTNNNAVENNKSSSK